jgi:hypothetical protein
MNDWTFWWNYESAGCTNTTEPSHYSTSGATVKANNSNSDFALLQLSENPNNLTNYNPAYLGWDRNTPGSGGVGIHHPSGDVKKISTYTMMPQSTAYSSNTVDPNGNHWRVVWSSGTTEGGSSGSALFNGNHRIIGQLHGGWANCNNLNEPDWYGKFSVSWTGDGASDNRRRLNYWLDPAGTNPNTLNGVCVAPRLSYISGPTEATWGWTTYYAYPSYSSGTYVWSVTPLYMASQTIITNGNQAMINFKMDGFATIECYYISPTCSIPKNVVDLDVEIYDGAASYSVVSSGKQVNVTPVTVAELQQSSPAGTINYSLHSLITGGLLASGQLHASGGILDFSSQSAGIYILKIEKADKKAETHKIVLK